MPEYSATLSSAQAFAKEDRLEEWVHLYLTHEGRNLPFSDGLKLTKRYYFGPAQYPLSLFTRCAGPEPEMKYRIDPDGWANRVSTLQNAIASEADLPPMIVNFTDGRFELNDGNHRHKAYENMGVEKVWVIVWITGEKEREEFRGKYCKVRP